MLDIILWLVGVEILGLAAFPLAYWLLPNLRDHGFSLSKPLGILLMGYLLWIFSVLRIAPSVQGMAVLLLVGLGVYSGWYAWRHRNELREFIIRERFILIASEVVFLTVFIGWAIYKFYDAPINHTEQPMDFGFLNASIRSVFGQPEDPWMRGEPISYYYFGYWMFGSLSELTGVVSSVSYNLSLALVPAMSAAAICGLLYSMVSAESCRTRYALFAGLAGALLLTVAANLEGVVEFMRANGMGSQGFWDWLQIGGMSGPASAITESWRPQEFMWWWRATRVIGSFEGDVQIDYTIHEFPAFSYILGDLHPHVMSLPFAMLFIGALWNQFRTCQTGGWPSNVKDYFTILFLGALLGGLAFTNMWDLPVFWGLLVCVLVVKTYGVHGGYLKQLLLGVLPVAFMVLAVALILYLPYFAGFFRGQVGGIAPVGTYSGVATTTSVSVSNSRPIHLFIVWALPLSAVAPFLLATFWQTKVKSDWTRLTWIALVVAFLPFGVWALLHLGRGGEPETLIGRLAHILPLSVLVGVATYGALWVARQDYPNRTGKLFALTVATVALLLIMGPELFYLDDVFVGAHERMNTVFKLYYQAWVLLAVAGGFATFYWNDLWERVSSSGRILTGLWAAVVLMFLVGSLYYSLSAAATKANSFRGHATLDGLYHVDGVERRAIEFLRDSTPSDVAIVEAVGDDYTSYGRISSSTGIPTVLGWADHESQWRGSREAFAGREEDVATIYNTANAAEALTLLERYDIDYVFVGPREEQKYGSAGLEKFQSFMDVVFQEGHVTIYQLPD